MSRSVGPILAIVLTAALCGIPAAASPANSLPTPLGVVVLATDANGKMDMALSGATLYDGDHLKTESNGTLRARLDRSQIYLGPNAAVDVHGASDGYSADLLYGMVVISSATSQSFRLSVNGVIIRPATSQATVVQVTKVNSHELLLNSERAAVQVSLDDEVRTVEAGESYRVVIQPEESSLDNTTGNPPQDKGGHPPEGPPTGGGGPYHTARNRFIWIAIFGVSAAAGIGIWRAVVSPTAP